MKRADLIGYAHAYLSFVLPRLKTPVKEIILFGSVARGDFGSESDVDLFFNGITEDEAKKLERELRTLQRLFAASKIQELWKQKGITNAIAVKAGVLEHWELKGSLLADGLMLHGKYVGKIAGEGHMLFSLPAIKNLAKRNKIVRALFGREEKTFKKKGLVPERGGTKISPTVFMVPLQFSPEIISLLRKEKIDFQLREMWMLQK